MKETQSQFSKLSKKQLIIISKELIDNDFPFDNPYNDYDYDDAYKTLENIGKYVNMSTTDEDVEFFTKFININDDVLAKIFETNDKSLYENIKIPVAKTYNLHYTLWGTCNYTEYKSSKFDSYDKDWVIDSAKQQRNDGNWDYFDGKDIREPDYENFEESDITFDEVYEVNDDNTINTNYVSESILDTLVIENTKDIINSLNKKTLLELKKIIDSKLRIF